jgi:DNA-binding transcriptional LysR family regulator
LPQSADVQVPVLPGVPPVSRVVAQFASVPVCGADEAKYLPVKWWCFPATAAPAGLAAAKPRVVMVAPAAAAVKNALVMRLGIWILPFLELRGQVVTSAGLGRPVPDLPCEELPR